MIRLKWKGCIYMPRNKMKPEYDAELTMQMLMDEVVSLYDPSDGHGLSIRQIAEELDMTILKVRKILISAGVFSSEICDRIIELKKEGKEIPEIQKITGLSRASVHSYLPYVKIAYNAREISLNVSEDIYLQNLKNRSMSVSERMQRRIRQKCAANDEAERRLSAAVEIIQNVKDVKQKDRLIRHVEGMLELAGCK